MLISTYAGELFLLQIMTKVDTPYQSTAKVETPYDRELFYSGTAPYDASFINYDTNVYSYEGATYTQKINVGYENTFKQETAYS